MLGALEVGVCACPGVGEEWVVEGKNRDLKDSSH